MTEPEMSTKLAPPLTAEEKCAKAADAIYVKTQWSNVTGGFTKTEKTCNERPVYYDEEHESWLAYSGQKKRWVVAKQLAKDGPTGAYVSSLKTDVFSPDWTGWRGTTTAVRVDAKGREHQRGEGGWIDESFPHNEESIGKNKAAGLGGVGKIEWPS